MNGRALSAAAVFGQLLSLFPFFCVAEGVSGAFVWWHYPLYFALLAAFCALGRLLSAWAAGSGFSSKQRGWALFASRAAAAVPAAVFVVVCAALGLSAGLYLYVLPACLIAYYGGHHTVGMVYSDVFSRGWFLLYFVTAVICSVLLWFTRDEGIIASGRFQLCLVFGILIVLAAVLTNQTNIDVRTAQRSSVLPRGLRGYNAALIAAVCVATAGLFLFAKPIAGLLGDGIKALTALILSLFRGGERLSLEEENEFWNDAENIEYYTANNALAQLFYFAVVVGLALLAVKFRRQIWELIKELFAPLFKQNARSEELPFVDEVSDSDAKSESARSRRRSEQQLLRRYKRESDPTAKYRMGYELFLRRLSRSPLPQVPSDTTTIHRQKGTGAFRREEIGGMVSVYNEVRYGGRVPTAEEIERQETLLEELR